MFHSGVNTLGMVLASRKEISEVEQLRGKASDDRESGLVRPFPLVLDVK